MGTPINVPTDGVTDAAPTIQAVLDAGGNVLLPPTSNVSVGQPGSGVAIYTPLRMKFQGQQLTGDPAGTRIVPYFGAGHAVLAQPVRAFPYASQSSLATGPGQSVLQPELLLDTEPRFTLFASSNQLTVSYFFKRRSVDTDATVHFQCGSNYAGNNRQMWGVWDNFGGLRVWWNNQSYNTALGVGQATDTVYFVALTYNGSRLKLLIAQPGQPLVAAVDVPVTGDVPMYPNGMDVVSIGFDCYGPHGALISHGPPDAYFDGFEFATAVRYNPGDAAPTAKPTAQANTVLVLNFEVQDPYFVGRRFASGGVVGTSYILPLNSTETQLGQFVISDLTFLGDRDASGPCLYDTINSRADRITCQSTWYGLTTRGTTFASTFNGLYGLARCVHFLQTTQSEETTASALYPSASGVAFYTGGPVGGSYSGVFVSPLGGALACVYCTGSNEVNIHGGQIDDEGQVGASLVAPVIADGAQVKLSGVQLVRTSVGPLVVCNGGGSVSIWGSWLVPSSTPGTAELIHFASAPGVCSTVLGCRIDGGVPVTLTPKWCVYVTNDGTMYVPALVQTDVAV